MAQISSCDSFRHDRNFYRLAYPIGERSQLTESTYCTKQFSDRHRVGISCVFATPPLVLPCRLICMTPRTTPRIARVPHTAKRPERCPYCGGSNHQPKGDAAKETRNRPSLALPRVQTHLYPRTGRSPQQDLSAAHGPFRANRLRHRLLPRRDRCAPEKEDAPHCFAIDGRVMAGALQAPLQLSPAARTRPLPLSRDPDDPHHQAIPPPSL